jgi:hypothetical protein
VPCGQAVDGKALLALQAMRADDGGGGFARFVKDFVGVESAGAALGLAWQVGRAPVASHLAASRGRAHSLHSVGTRAYEWAERSGGGAQLTQPIEPPPPPGARTAANRNVGRARAQTMGVAQASVQLADLTSADELPALG